LIWITAHGIADETTSKNFRKNLKIMKGAMRSLDGNMKN
jgi:hypothetical protein